MRHGLALRDGATRLLRVRITLLMLRAAEGRVSKHEARD
jgi:hypothetical protein